MSIIRINEVNVNYQQTGKGKDIVCLHGWGQNIAMMEKISSHFESNYRVTVLDFPGFGMSDNPTKAWDLEDYTHFFASFLKELKIEDPIIIGHSFGCRVAINYAAQFAVDSMVLTGAAGLRPKRDLAWYIRTYTYKTLKVLVKLPVLNRFEEQFKSYFGSEDYKQSSGVMRETFVKIVNSDVRDVLSSVTVPVLLVWGALDDATPLWMGKEMEKLMPNAGLAIFENDDHYAYFNQWDRFNRCITIFLENKEN